MEHCKTPAILLKCYDYGESDRLFIFFTRYFGKVALIGKGARKSRFRHLATIDLLTRLDIVFKINENSDLHLLDSIEMVEPFFELREDVKLVCAGIYFADLINEFFKDGVHNEQLFDEFLFFLGKLKVGAFKSSSVPIFQLRLLEKSGLAPNLSSCVKCGESVPAHIGAGKPLHFSVEKGGYICEACGKSYYHSRRREVSLGTLKLLELARTSALENLSRINFAGQVLKESETLLEDFVRHQLGKNIASYEYLKRVMRKL